MARSATIAPSAVEIGERTAVNGHRRGPAGQLQEAGVTGGCDRNEGRHPPQVGLEVLGAVQRSVRAGPRHAWLPQLAPEAAQRVVQPRLGVVPADLGAYRQRLRLHHRPHLDRRWWRPFEERTQRCHAGLGLFELTLHVAQMVDDHPVALVGAGRGEDCLDLFERHVHFTEQLGALAREGLEVLKDAPPERRALLEEMVAFSDFLVDRIGAMQHEWEAHRDALRASGDLPG